MLSLPKYALLVDALLAIVVLLDGCGGAANAFDDKGDDGNGENIDDQVGGGDDDDDDRERLAEEWTGGRGEIEKGDADGGRGGEVAAEGGSRLEDILLLRIAVG